MTSFTDLGLAAPILSALAAEGYEKPTPIQEQAIPYLLKGEDLLGIAQTGTGKTAAFALPIIDRLSRDRKPAPRHGCRALVLSPTRELASQIAESFRSYARNLKLRVAVVFGGVSARPQAQELARGVDILVATPGRLLDHLDGRAVMLDHVEVFVLDEADQMLDMGFIHAIRRVVPRLPKVRQNLFFSATMPKEIGMLAGELLRNPVEVSVTPVATTAERIAQKVIFVETARKRGLLVELLRDDVMGRTLVFSRTKHGADRIVRNLEDSGIPAAAIHGNKSQGQREKALADFRAGRRKILVATDIAARGIDVDGVTHVVNYDLPNVPESYVHRIGRTARAGADGSAISFCDAEERPYLRDIEKITRQSIPSEDRRLPATVAAEAQARPAAKQGKPGGRGPGKPGSKPAGKPAAGAGRGDAPGRGRQRFSSSEQGQGRGSAGGFGARRNSRGQGGQDRAAGDGMSGVAFMKPARGR
ncbi:DEAD/DEAH box helicase [Pseudochelatococcus contaminans]|uniref:DEAD-box ATP-dependent RNA helicase RhpA n=1 Tax=Pseudochelatococcus contaminans TaxID=1538103 RepID=A0A7W5Z4I5_9HYPH|nr:DEAD/DEAH box helicase [Pseudochelatococcus contaminans]MBB3809559.1 ATP-dependent RNA helicase RhlE [Pseudochelatococcus contaminans]